MRVGHGRLYIMRIPLRSREPGNPSEPGQPLRQTGRPGEPGTLSRPTALLVAGAMFMELLDGTALTTAAPKVAAAFHVSSVAMAGPISAYLVTVAAFIPLGGWAVDRFGGRRTFALAVLLFTAASVACALAPSLLALDAARIAQGVGGALMVPVGRLVVLRGIRREEVIRAVAFLTWPALAAPLLGPLVGGLLATYASWRWIFLVNVPLGVIALCFIRTIPVDRGPARRLDVPGWCLSAASLGSLTAAASIAAIPGSNPWTAGGCLFVAIVTGVLAVQRMRTAADPLLRLDALRIRTFRFAHAGGSVFRIAINSVAFLVPLLFVDAFGWTPAHAGEAFVALYAGNLGIKPTTTPLLRRFGFRTVVIGAVFGSIATTALIATLQGSTPLVLILLLLVASGAFRSIGFTVYNTVAYADIDAAGLADANTLSSAIQQLAVGLGAAAGALAVRFTLALGAHQPYQAAFLVIAAALLISAVEALLLPRDVGSALTRREPKPKTEPEPATPTA
jgi:MFS family permease